MTESPQAQVRLVSPLSATETRVLERMARGESNREIGRALGTTANTAKFHLTSVLRKLRTQTRLQAVIRGLQLGLIALDLIDVPVTESVLKRNFRGAQVLVRAEARAA